METYVAEPWHDPALSATRWTRLSMGYESVDLATASPQDQIDSLTGFNTTPSSNMAVDILLADGPCLQAKLVALDKMLGSYWAPTNDIGIGLSNFDRALKEHSGSEAAVTRRNTYHDKFYDESAFDDTSKSSLQNLFVGTTLGGRSLAKLVLDETVDGKPLFYSAIHENDSAEVMDVSPIRAVTFMRHARRYTPKGGEQYAELIGPIHEIADEMFDFAFNKAKRERNYGALVELCVGSDFQFMAAKYVNSAEDPSAAKEEVVRLTESIVTSAEKLSACYQPELQSKVEESFLRVGLRFIYGLARHQENGKQTVDQINLSDDFALPVNLEGDEPQVLVAELIAAVDEIHDAVTSDDSLLIEKTKSDQFRLFRYVTRKDGACRSSVQEYVRPYGGYAYDLMYEYGRPSEGVEASHSFIRSKRPYLHSSKDSQDNSTISIRIDFEGSDPRGGRNVEGDRDPAAKVGTLSLDIGSILGPNNNLGVRIGRFLAWSDQLRVRKLGQGRPEQRPSFNHGYEAFRTGDRDEFGRQLREVIAARRSDPRFQSFDELSKLALLAS